MLLDKLGIPLASIAYNLSKIKERRLGYRLRLANLSNDWLQGEMVIEMDGVWKREGLDAIGTNYFTIGAIKNGISTRFDPNSLYYQTWLGGYIVRFANGREWAIDDHYKLAVADQKNWLRMYGDSKPFVKVEQKSAEDLGEVTISGFKGRLYKGICISDTDVGDKKISLYNTALLSGMTYYINQSNSKLKLITENVIPRWTAKEILKPYQQITLTGYCVILELPNKTKAILYINAADYTDINGKQHQNFEKVEKEFLHTVKNIEILKI